MKKIIMVILKEAKNVDLACQFIKTRQEIRVGK
jgi:spermidine/putrescine-binding protein